MMILTYTMTLIDTLWPIVFVGLITVLLIVFKEGIRQSVLQKIIPYFFLAMIIILELNTFANIGIGFYYSEMTGLVFLPLHLCSISAVLIMLYLSTKKELFLDILIIQGIVGAIVTFIFPSSTAAPTTFEYWRFFLSHTLLFIVPVYFIIIEHKRVDQRILKIAFVSVHLFAAIAVLFNLTVGSDYMYLSPDNKHNLFAFIPVHQVFPFLGQWPGVILFGELLTFPVYFSVYYIIKKLQVNLDEPIKEGVYYEDHRRTV
ncbi:MAG: TIGR02206 family membrane protein [Candidatus Izimaplasma sp.]|nr:TIGR02206 family membrane protein [Candidatus Izimaplasma bacterium]